MDETPSFQAMAETIPSLAWQADPTGAIFWYNPQWYAYTGTTLEEMRGWGWSKCHHPKMLPIVMERWTGALNAQKPFEMVFPLKGVDGTYRPFLTRVAPSFFDGKLTGWFGANIDISGMTTGGILAAELFVVEGVK